MIKKVLVLIFCVGIASCSSLMGNDNRNPLAFAKDGITFNVTASHDLNFYKGESHACMLTIYQLSQPTMFQQMLTSRAGIAQLISAAEFDKSVIGVKREAIQPRQRAEILVDRMEGSRYIGIVAGYYHGQKELMSMVFPVRLRKNITFFWRDIDQSPKMKLNLHMGRTRISGRHRTPLR